MKKRGIFFKVFSYTAIFLVLLVCVTVGLFSQQFISFYNTSQTEQLFSTYRSLHEQLRGKEINEVIIIAQQYYENNQSFSFYIRDADNTVIYSTPNLDIQDKNNTRIMISVGENYILGASNREAVQTGYGDLISKSLLALSCMLILGLIGAFIFAWQMTKPIKSLSENTKRMSNLEDILYIAERNDELGDLASDVHSMYNKLKETISKLEEEIERVREMEENQRYFFSAASHELKTPIAAATVMVEGMLADIGDYKNHTKYLRECMKTLKTQSKIISEIIDIVNLSDGMILPSPEKINMFELISAVLSEYYALAESKEQSVSISLDENIYCCADKNWLGRVISNIIMNAVQNSPNRENINIWSKENKETVTLNILNTGVFIDKQIMSKLFEPFFRADKARSSGNGHSGLGLTIVKKLLDAMEIPFSLDNTDEGVLFMLEIDKLPN